MSNEYKDYYKDIERTNDDISSCLECGGAIVSLEELRAKRRKTDERIRDRNLIFITFYYIIKEKEGKIQNEFQRRGYEP